MASIKCVPFGCEIKEKEILGEKGEAGAFRLKSKMAVRSLFNQGTGAHARTDAIASLLELKISRDLCLTRIGYA